jgi:DNA segregation ATPase FtsK/SpoIIIE, S-DNA-T family
MSVYPKDKTSEVIGLLCFASFVMLTLSLVSYSQQDPSLNVSSSSHIYDNYAGRVGAWTSDTLLQGLGLGAFLLPLVFLAIGFKLVRRRPLEYPFLKLAGFCCALLALCAGVTLLVPSEIPGLKFSPGGIAGILMSDLLLQHLNRPGSIVVAATAFLLSVVLTTRFSIEGTVERAGKLRWNPAASWRSALGGWKKRRQERKELARLKKTKTVMTQTVPKKITLERPGETAPEAEEVRDRDPEVRRPAPPAESREAAPGDGTLPMAAQRLDLNRPYRLPRLDFLQDQKAEDVIDEQELIERAHKLTTKCAEFDVLGRVVQIHPGPVVTTFEFKPDAGVKYNRVTGLTEDLCLALKAESIRIDRIPGKNTVGIEAPNITRQTILLRDIFSSAAYQQSLSKLTLGLGKLINGSVYIADLVRMPHLLIAGATGSGKSVALNCMVCSILYKAHPAEVRFIMIDPKRLELGVYDGIPHLLTPIVTDPKQAANALNWGVNEMEQRYRLLAQRGVRNIEQYNRLVLSEERNNPELEPLPYIIIIVDELADLMMTAGKDVEAALTRLAQMARAIGIHLILATQRPSVDVLTGLIKANFPCRISFRVSSKVDSRTILDCNGAEQLLGNGDSLLLSPGSSRLVRVHGAFISEGEIARVVGFLKEQAAPQYREEILEGEEEEDTGPGLTDLNELDDDLYEEAARFVVETGKASTSLLQRRLRIGYGRAARLLDMMQHDGLIGPPDGSRAREVLVSSDYFDEPFKN